MTVEWKLEVKQAHRDMGPDGGQSLCKGPEAGRGCFGLALCQEAAGEARVKSGKGSTKFPNFSRIY